MLISIGHGEKFVQIGASLGAVERSSEVAPPEAIALVPGEPIAPSQLAAAPVATSPSDRFGYMFAGTGLADDPAAFEKLGAVGSAMLDNGPFPGPGDGVPAVLTYFGQFIDHDITANTDRDPAELPAFSIAAAPLTRNARPDVMAQLGNLRHGSLRLDSLYGDGTDIDTLLRDGAMMRIGETDAGAPNDLPRCGKMVDGGVLSEQLLAELFPDVPTEAARKRAFIGDSRNDENLVVAQLHLAFLRFHNAIAATLTGTDDERFAAARTEVIRHYQWLVVETYLAELCDPTILASVKAAGAVRYRTFSAAHGGVAGAHAPLPLEFSVAAFRFGHSMIRERYVFNTNFPQATLAELFRFTGKGGLGGLEQLMQVWAIDWRNFIGTDEPAKLARPLDPELASQLHDLPNEDALLRALASRNLRRSYVLDLPLAQGVIIELEAEGTAMAPLGEAELCAGTAGAALCEGGYGSGTPLWFYILAEAAVRGGGRRLGPLGSLIVCETLIGLLATDPESYWNIPGSADGRWSPADAGLAPAPIDNFEALFAFAGVL